METIIVPREIGQRAIWINAPHWQGNLSEFMEALKRGVTHWINTTNSGERIKAENGGVFTLADLAGYTPDCFLKATTLGGCLNDAGIILVTIKLIDTDIDAAIVGIDSDTNLYEGE